MKEEHAQRLANHPFLQGADDSCETSLVARQPVFDINGRIWGYELLFREVDPQVGRAFDDRRATSTVMIDGFELLRPSLRPGQHFLINFSAEFLESELPKVLPPDVCGIEILESVQPTPSVIKGLLNLKKYGYLLALDDYVGQEKLSPFLPLVDIVKVDVLHLREDEITSLTHDLAKYPAKLLAEKVEDQQMASFCRESGFSLFQGYFYSKAETVYGKKLHPSQASKTRLLLLSSEDKLDAMALREIISSDIYLSFRLLKFINSVYFGLPTKIVTVDHAIVLLGMQKIRQWLFVTALAGINTSPMAQEIVFIAAFRAKFLEMLSRQKADVRHSELSSKLFMTGLFSLLENILQVPFNEIAASLPLPTEVQQVLGGGTGPLSPWLHLMQSYEQGKWQEMRAFAQELDIADCELAAAYVEAGNWTKSVFASYEVSTHDQQ